MQGVGTTGVTGSSSFSGKSAADKYSALAQLDVAVKEVTLKDNPPSNEKLSESWGSSASSQNVNPFGAAPAPAGMTQPQHNPFMAGGSAMQQQQGFGQFVSAQPQAMPQQSGWAQPQVPVYNNPQQAGFGNAQFQGQAGFPAAGGFAQQPQQGMFGAAQFSGGFPQQQGQWQSQPTQQFSQQRPPQQQQQQQQQWQQQQRQQQQRQQQQQPVFGSASQSFGVSKSTSATSASSATNTDMQLGWSSGLSKPIATTSNPAGETATSSSGAGWSSGLTAPAPQPSSQTNWNTPAAGGNMQQQNWSGSGSSMQSGGGWGSAGQQSMFGAAPQQQTQMQQNQMFGSAPAFRQPNQMYMAQQPQMFGSAAQQQQMFGMPNQQPQQQSFGTWSQNTNPQQQGGFNWSNQAMPGGGLQRKDSKNIIVGNWGTQPSNFQQGDMTNYVPNMNTSNPFMVGQHLLLICIRHLYQLLFCRHQVTKACLIIHSCSVPNY